MTAPLRALTPAAPIGYFVHHQGRGHAERCAAIVNALPAHRPVTIFCARDDIFPPLRAGVEIVVIPSLFEPTGAEAAQDFTAQPDTLHCAPLGWPGIRQAMGTMAAWFMTANPALMISDVSAEVAQLARICSVPHVKVLQHGQRTDPGHRAAYDGAAGLLVPSAACLAQDDWDDAMRAKTFFAGGLGVDTALPSRADARKRLEIQADKDVVLVLSGGGGTGFPSAPIAVGARAATDSQWLTVGKIARDWHATEPANLRHDGWVDNVADYIAAADCIVASTGNTTCQHVLAAGKPWVAVPEWRYFDEQVEKARVLQKAGVAHAVPGLPSSVQQWRAAIAAARGSHDPARQRACVTEGAADLTAAWLEDLILRLWPQGATPIPTESRPPARAEA
ncbi:glycosyltransferase [Loktanella salsilacus]|uniref:glycosyltransferase n=1 Tax=Loktanella salsilacus TaxID=195913 RepID=UPI00373592A5